MGMRHVLVTGLALAGVFCAGCLSSPADTDQEGGSVSETAGARSAKNSAPVPDAGIDQAVVAGDLVVLNGTQSKDEDGDQLMFIWQQVEGDAAVELDQPYASISRFEAPEVTEETVLKFRLITVDGFAATVDEVDVTVSPAL